MFVILSAAKNPSRIDAKAERDSSRKTGALNGGIEDGVRDICSICLASGARFWRSGGRNYFLKCLSLPPMGINEVIGP